MFSKHGFGDFHRKLIVYQEIVYSTYTYVSFSKALSAGKL